MNCFARCCALIALFVPLGACGGADPRPVDARARVAGVLEAQHFPPSTDVAAGDRLFATGSHTLMVVNREGKVEQRMIVLGERDGGFVVVRQGVGAGDRSIARGLQKARPGSVVNALTREEMQKKLAASANLAARAAARSNAAPACCW